MMPPYRAEVKLQIQKINYTTGALTVLWDTTFAARDLQAYPLYNNKYVVTKQFPVYESKDKLNGSYGIKYTHNGMIWQAGEASDVVPGMLSEILEVNL